jgi:hypothetical protein
MNTNSQLSTPTPQPADSDPWRGGFSDGSQFDTNDDGDEVPVWCVYVGDEEAEPVHRIYWLWSSIYGISGLSMSPGGLKQRTWGERVRPSPTSELRTRMLDFWKTPQAGYACTRQSWQTGRQVGLDLVSDENVGMQALIP